MDYLFANERVVNTVYVSHMNYTYHMVQIADYDVGVITPFYEEGKPVEQGARFSMIRWGSQVDLVLPLDKRYEFEPVNQVTEHVDAGVDKLVEVKRT